MGAIAVANQVKEIEPDIDAKIKEIRDFIRDKIKAGLESEEVKEIINRSMQKSLNAQESLR